MALLLHGCGRNRANAGDYDLATAREIMAAGFEQADTVEIYTLTWPGEYGKEYLVRSISRADNPEFWERAIIGLRRAAPRAVANGCVPEIHIRLRAGGQTLATGWAIPPVDEIGFYLPGNQKIVVCSAEVAELLRPFHDQVVESQALGNPRPPDPSEPPVPSFAEVHQRMIELFRGCDYINVHAPGENSMGVDVRGEASEEWRTMTKAVEEASKGWAIPGGRPEVYIWCDVAETPSDLIELHYVGGILGSRRGELGGNVQTLRPTASFRQALESLLRRAREKEGSGTEPSTRQGDS
jgi:hypothetical protein